MLQPVHRVEGANTGSEKPADLEPAVRDRLAQHRQTQPDIELPERSNRRSFRQAELQACDVTARLDDAREFAKYRARIVDVAQQVRKRQMLERRGRKGKLLCPRLDEGDSRGLSCFSDSPATHLQHVEALIHTDDAAVVPSCERNSDRSSAGGNIQHYIVGTCFDARDQETAPSRVLPEAQEVRVAIIRRGERRKELLSALVSLGHGRHRTIVALVALEDEVREAFDAATAHAVAGETVSGVLPSEPSEGLRIYLCCFEGNDGRAWLALDSERRPVGDRSLVREAVSITAMCELAEESAGGGDLPELRAQLAHLRQTENPEGIGEAERAAEALEQSLQPEPRVASVPYLDAIGAAAHELERALGEMTGSPFAQAMKSALPAAEELAREVERNYKIPLA